MKAKTTKRKTTHRKKSKMSGVRKHKRKSRIHGAGGIDMTAILLTIGGAVGASLLDKVIPDTIDKKIVAGAKMVVGVVLPMISKDAKTKHILQSVGNGVLAVGTIDLLKGMDIISGADENGNDLFIAMSGTENVLAGADDINVINGGVDVLAGEGEDLSIVNGYSDDDDDDMM